ncbi:ComEA family DNA-binding protein [uncultured Corynebacterium sp.]|uniref:ComEA family DNA-binding protein n=1 Tax=uncultured Corynebacterium sp. TaxID=159447 RepID=UPI0025972A51|nr:ComEA family DNA-binding protein [uncultured Corynebacterium sp.]
MNATTTVDRLRELTRPTGEEDVIEVRYPPPRFTVSPKQAAAVAGAVLAAVGAWAVLRPAPQELGPATWDTAAATASSVTAAPSSIVVSVVGEVDRPGLATLEPGARVADALAAAGPRPGADLAALNQAQPLADGQQIHVVAQGAAPPGPPAAPGETGSGNAGLVSLNTATAQELTALPGVGEATAAAIVAHREKNGPFTSVDKLNDVKGIGPAKFEALKDLVTV